MSPCSFKTIASRFTFLILICLQFRVVTACPHFVRLAPSFDISASNVIGVPDNSILYLNVDDPIGTPDDETTLVESVPGSLDAQITMGFTGLWTAPPEVVTRLTVFCRARLGSAPSGNISVELYDGESLVRRGPAWALLPNFTTFSDSFDALCVSSAESLRVRVILTNPTGTGLLQLTQLWSDVTTLVTNTRIEHFDHAPTGWDSIRNRVGDPGCVDITTNFGYSFTNHANGQGTGEIGGQFWRSMIYQSFSKVIETKSLNDHLSASGLIRVTDMDDGGGLLFGWHNGEEGWRNPNSLMFRIDGNVSDAGVYFEYGTSIWRADGRAYTDTHYTNERLHEGQTYEWALSYDPGSPGGPGEIQFSIQGFGYVGHLAVPATHKEDGATFTRFGFINQQVPGHRIVAYIDDVTLDGVIEHFDIQPSDWIGNNFNLSGYPDCMQAGRHSFGCSNTNYAGVTAGEMGGLVWRMDFPNQSGHCGAYIEPLSLDDELYAAGSIAMTQGSSDGEVFFGWAYSGSTFNCCCDPEESICPANENTCPPINFMGTLVAGSSSEGWFFQPAYRARNTSGVRAGRGPRIFPNGERRKFALHYVPLEDGTGRLTTSLDNEYAVQNVSAEDRALGVDGLNFFALITRQPGGHAMTIYIDDILYTSGPSSPPPATPTEVVIKRSAVSPSLELHWQRVQQDINGQPLTEVVYRIERSGAPDFESSQVISIVPDTTFTDVIESEVAFYRILAISCE